MGSFLKYCAPQPRALHVITYTKLELFQSMSSSIFIRYLFPLMEDVTVESNEMWWHVKHLLALYKQPPSRSVKALKRKMERLHSKYVFAPADKAANNVIIIWKKVLRRCFKGGPEFY